jgi:CO/xanthine dehydrogenase Mo-binding subunit
MDSREDNVARDAPTPRDVAIAQGDRVCNGIGGSPRRLEDARLVTGRGLYVDDISRPGMLFAVVVRSSHAHARIVKIDPSAATRAKDFVRCLTAADIEPMHSIPIRMGPDPALSRYLQKPLASDVVRYVGEPVAIVLAETFHGAVDAAEMVDIEYQPLEVIADAEAARVNGQVLSQWNVGFGDVESDFAQADCVVRERFTISRQTAIPIEPRGLIAEFDSGRRFLTMWGPTKVPHFNRAVLSTMLGIPESQIHFIEPDVGGGFGVRGEFYPEDFLVPFAAVVAGRAVKWIETRQEHFLSINHSRGQNWEIAIAARKDGTLLGIDASLLHDQGAYIRTHGILVPAVSAAHLTGPYRMTSYRCAVVCVSTNRTPMATIRGPGLFEGNFVRERVVDMLAHELGIDPLELRRRNLIPHKMMPYNVGTNILGHPVVLHSANFERMFDKALHFAQSKQGDTRKLGYLTGSGTAAMAEPTGLGPYESARVEVDPTGAIRVCTGATSQGQSQETTLAQICSEVLQVPLEDITVIHGDTQLLRFGVGTFASRTAVMAGNAVYKAAKIVYERALDLASQYLEVAPVDLEYKAGGFYIAGVPKCAVTIGELASLAAPGWPRPNIRRSEAMQDGLSATAYFESLGDTCSFAVHQAHVTVNLSTGEVAVDRYIVAADAGRAINPMVVEGQLVGGAVQGISGALYEHLAYDDDGQLLSGTLMDYSLPRANDFKQIDSLIFEDEPAPNPLGVKGIGESGTSGAGAAIANAIADALRQFGVRVIDLPLTPERVWRMIQDVQNA